MPPTAQFDYLPLLLRKQGPARYAPVVIPENPLTTANKQNRSSHGGGLSARTGAIVTAWTARQQKRSEDGLPQIKGIPLLLKIDTTLDIDALRHTFQFEIVSEEPDGLSRQDLLSYFLQLLQLVDAKDIYRQLRDRLQIASNLPLHHQTGKSAV